MSSSILWDYFTTTVDASKAKCKLCNKLVSRGGTGKNATTSNLASHLKSNHPEQHKKYLTAKTERSVSTKLTTSAELPGTSTSTSASTSQLTLQESIDRKAVFDRDHPRVKQINKIIAELIAVDYQPFSLVENIGFRRLINFLEPRYKIPTRYFFRETLHPNLLKAVQQKIHTILSDISAFSFTSDIWTAASNNESFISLTGHFINDSFSHQSMVVGVKHCPGTLNKSGERLLVAKGGEGGSAKTNFIGEAAIPHVLHLHLKLIADIGFVGFPNAGKSTLLKALSRTDPLISAFPFTTIRPQIGVMVYEDHRQISLADLPGLIEGAHLNKGMGHKFLKHVERTMMLLFIVDLNGFQLSINDRFRNAYETIILLNKELEMYDPSLLDKPAVLLINKMDTDNNNYKFNKLVEQLNKRKQDSSIPKQYLPEKFIEFLEVLPICAKDRESTNDLKETLRKFLDVIDSLKKKQRISDEKTMQVIQADEAVTIKSFV